MRIHISKSITILIMFLCCLAATAQNRCNINGIVVDINTLPISYVSAVLHDDGKILTSGITDDNGRFSLTVTSSSKEIELSVEFIGFIKKVIKISPTGKTINLSKIILEEDTHHLDEVVVTAKTESQKQSLERTSINASANMASAKGSAIDVLSSASSVTISNDVISIRGSSLAAVAKVASQSTEIPTISKCMDLLSLDRILEMGIPLT